MGPGAVDATDDGVFAVIDTGGLGLVTVASGQPSRASLDWPGIKSLIDVAAVDHGFRILDLDELSLQPRVVEVTADGEVSRSVDLPPGLWLEDGLSGIATGPGGELWVELEGGARVAVFDQTTGEYEEHSGYPYPDGLYGQAVEEPFPESIRFVAGDAEVTVETDPGSSVGARLLALNPDRSFVVEKTEVSQDAGGVLLAETSALWFDAGGSLLGEALLPLEDQFTYVASPVVIGPDGLVYYLLTRPDDVAILGIPWNEPAD